MKYRTMAEFERSGWGVLTAIILFVIILTVFVIFIRHRAALEAAAINAETGSTLTGDDILLYGDKIRVIPGK